MEDIVKRQRDLWVMLEYPVERLITKSLLFKAIHGIAPNCLSDRIGMRFDIHSYDSREAGSMSVYLPTAHKEI